MAFQKHVRILTMTLALFCVTNVIWGQFSFQTPTNFSVPYPAISVSGESTINCLPDTIQLVLTVQSKGKTIEEAISNMKSEQNVAIEKIQQIGFEKDQISVENYGFNTMQESQQRRMETMVMQRMGKANQKTTTLSEQVLLSCKLFAKRPIEGKTIEEIIAESYQLKQKINAAGFALKKEELTPEEEELLEEMEGMPTSYSYSEESESPLEPKLFYMASISDEDGQKAYAEAFKQARKNGEFLAKAANGELGTLMQLSATIGKNQKYSDPRSQHNMDYYAMQVLNLGAGAFNTPPTQKIEYSAITPDTMTFTFTVQTLFSLEK